MTYAGLSPLLVSAIPPLLPGVRVGTRTPADLQDVVPFIRVWEMGGPSIPDLPDLKALALEVDFFHSDEPSAEALGIAFETALHALVGSSVGGATVLRVHTNTNPAYRPWDDPNVARKGANFQVWIFAR